MGVCVACLSSRIGRTPSRMMKGVPTVRQDMPAAANLVATCFSAVM
jgi:hypothetical protein